MAIDFLPEARGSADSTTLSLNYIDVEILNFIHLTYISALSGKYNQIIPY